MCVLAHPDDESLGTGGILARYANEGIDTFVITATQSVAGPTVPVAAGGAGFAAVESARGESKAADAAGKTMKVPVSELRMRSGDATAPRSR